MGIWNKGFPKKVVALVACVALGLGVAVAAAADETGGRALSMGTAGLADKANTADAATVYYGGNAYRVIGYDGTGVASESGTMTLLSKGNRGSACFNESEWNNAYADSTLRKTIEGYDTGEGAHVAGIVDELTEAERTAIVPRDLVSGIYDGYDTDCVAGTQVPGTLIWPLSTKEADNLNTSLAQADPAHPGWLSSFWWLRSPGVDDFYAACVYGPGDVYDYGTTWTALSASAPLSI